MPEVENRTTDRPLPPRQTNIRPDQTMRQRGMNPNWLWIVGVAVVAAILIMFLMPGDQTNRNATVDQPAQTGQNVSPGTGTGTTTGSAPTTPAAPQTDTTGSTGNTNTGGTNTGSTSGTPAQ